MKSIQFFLVAVLLSTMTLTVFLSALHGYRTSIVEIKELLDTELADRARLLGMIGASGKPVAMPVSVPPSYAFQIWHDQQLMQRSDNSPQTPIATRTGFQNRNFSGHRWRTFTWVAGDGQHRSITAERIDVRNALAEDIVMRSVLPVVIALPLAGILIWFIVGHGLAPLHELARHLRQRRANDLQPVPMQNQPAELQQLVSSTNELLQRLNASFARERQFASDAAHELRTPISALKVHLHNLLCQLPENDEELLQLKAATDRMSHIVEQILILYRTAPDQYATQLKQLDLHALAQEIIADMYPHFEQRHIEPELLGTEALMAGDRFALSLLLRNLLDNACKYTPANGKVRTTVSTGPGDAVTLRIEDSGPGISADQYQRIFDRFYRVGGDQHVSNAAGCGLGLSIVGHIAELHEAGIEPGPSSFDSGFAITLVFPVHRLRQSRPGITDA